MERTKVWKTRALFCYHWRCFSSAAVTGEEQQMTVRKRGSRWWYDFRLRGIRYREPIPEAQTKAQALQAEAKIRSDLFGGRYGGIRLTPLLAAWINDTYLPWAHSN